MGRAGGGTLAGPRRPHPPLPRRITEKEPEPGGGGAEAAPGSPQQR